MRERAEIRSSKGLDGPCLVEENSTRGYSSAAVCGDVIKSCIQRVLVELLHVPDVAGEFVRRFTICGTQARGKS
jgi:hypothetical protein